LGIEMIIDNKFVGENL